MEAEWKAAEEAYFQVVAENERKEKIRRLEKEAKRLEEIRLLEQAKRLSAIRLVQEELASLKTQDEYYEEMSRREREADRLAEIRE